MEQIKCKVKHKLNSSMGMSLGEILLAVLIMLLSTSLLVSTVSLGLNQYLNSLSRSEASTLSSTLQSVITNELAYTQYIEEDEGTYTYQSQNYTQEYADTGEHWYKIFDKEGKVYIGIDDNNCLPVLGDGSYPNDLKVENVAVSYNDENHTFTVSYKITRKGETILNPTFQVINVTNTKLTK